MQALNKGITTYIILTAFAMVFGIVSIAVASTLITFTAWLLAIGLLIYGFRFTTRVVSTEGTNAEHDKTDEKMYTSLMVNSLTAFFTAVMLLTGLGVGIVGSQVLAFAAPLMFWAYLGKLWFSGHLTGEKPKFPEIPQ